MIDAHHSLIKGLLDKSEDFRVNLGRTWIKG
jgi:hypothetical protein